MKKLILAAAVVFSSGLYAQTDFSAVLIKDLNVLSISVADDGLITPFEAGELWASMKGTEQRKYIDQEGFNMECDALRNHANEIYGSCTFNIPMNSFLKVGEVQVFKLKGSAAARLNRYFNDSAYVSIQGGRVYLNSYNTKREFYFGIHDSLIKR
ncbi:hypothetical protein DOM21_01585 [Bacteriovorax stolpii]|uniref:Uncharacterized protein n=1 Tax=Bacteriovorax stolpii TaxID=960 RepID=A0A2K9NWF3_BACTC|nr:hypothetical protein [Bacteriovorax stolpii]AUN99836.1 hypothetical protein C0V70_17345 [Bacteriovorax stolpii]QDK40171.1 hypothetical protein DOM21_01585 [Bacteriovorax stolpii]TDP54272.1 hypothetical protein C8D79_1566 [Bacteriovorax stolpii]